jgi:type IV secretory pathway VirB10-like protein
MSDQLGPDFDERLRASLERFQPPSPLPEGARFSRSRPVARRLRRMQLSLVIAGALVVATFVAASAAAGGPPSTWPQRAVTTVQSVTHVGENPAPSSPEKKPEAPPRPPVEAQPPKAAESSHRSPEPSKDSQTEPRESPDASPNQSHDHGSSPAPHPDDGQSTSRFGTPSEN